MQSLWILMFAAFVAPPVFAADEENPVACAAYENHIEYFAPSGGKTTMFECGLASQAGGFPLLKWREKRLLVSCNDLSKKDPNAVASANLVNEKTGERYRISVSAKSSCRNYEFCRETTNAETGKSESVCAEYPENAMISVAFGSTAMCGVVGDGRVYDIKNTYKLGKVSPDSPPFIPLPLAHFPQDVKTAYGEYINRCWPENWDGQGLKGKALKKHKALKSECSNSAQTYWKSVSDSYASSCQNYITSKLVKKVETLNQQGQPKLNQPTQPDQNKENLPSPSQGDAPPPAPDAGNNAGDPNKKPE